MVYTAVDNIIVIPSSKLDGAMKIKVMDHLVIADAQFTSFVETGSSISPQNTIPEASNLYCVKENIIKQYSNGLPAIKFISDNTATIINNLNKINGRILTLKEIKDLHNELGKRLEIEDNKIEAQEFKNLKKVVDDLNQAKLSLKQEKAHEKAIQNPLLEDMEMIQ